MAPSAGDDLIGGPGSPRRPAGQPTYRLSRQGHGDPPVLVAPFRRPSEGLGNWTHDLVVPAARHHAGRGAARVLIAVEIGPLARGGYTARIQLAARATAARARRGRSSEDLEPPGSCSGTRLPAAYPATGEGPHDERRAKPPDIAKGEAHQIVQPRPELRGRIPTASDVTVRRPARRDRTRTTPARRSGGLARQSRRSVSVFLSRSFTRRDPTSAG